MKKHLFVLPLCAVIGTALAFARHSLVGHWNVVYGNGPRGHVVFRRNGTFEATFTGEKWKVGGQYKMDGDIGTMADSSCGLHYWAKYNFNWYTDDSVRVTVVEDTCSGRRANADGSVMVRAK